MESPVMKVTDEQSVTRKSVPPRPRLPSTQPNRRYITTPMMVRMLGVKTPLKVPKP